MSYTVEQKSMLAKLMAEEDINVEHKNTNTSYFDLRSRTLVCPIWKDMSGDLYDLLLGHEISHALNTPTEGWHDVLVEQKRKRFKHFINVVEDARIERLIKLKYPGLRQPMYRGYKALLEKDFFGLSALGDVSGLYLIDKLNLFTKLGSFITIRFTKEEQPFAGAIEKIETWDQAVDLARKIYEYSKKEQEEGEEKRKKEREDAQEKLRQLMEDGENEEGEGESDDTEHISSYSDESDDEDDSLDPDGENGNRESENKDTETGVEKGKNEEPTGNTPEPGNDGGGEGADDSEDRKEDFQPLCRTDEAFRRNEGKLVDLNPNREVYNFNIPTPNLDEIIVPSENVEYTIFESIIRTTHQKQAALKLYNEFKKKNSDYIQLLVKEFEMRKAAKKFEKSKVADSGDFDLNKIFRYRLDDDIFNKITMVPKGKSHGLVLLLDWSGSMAPHARGAMEQIFILALFCKKVNIPFQAYSFTSIGLGEEFISFFPGKDKSTPIRQFSTMENDLHMRALDLHEIINSSMTTHQMAMVIAGHLFLEAYTSITTSVDRTAIPRSLSMGGTPLHEALIALRDIVKKFKRGHRLDIVNTIVVHDGDADDTKSYYYQNPIHINQNLKCTRTFVYSGNRVSFVDKKEKVTVQVDQDGGRRAATEAIMKWFRLTTGSGLFGFYITNKSPKNLRYALREYYRNEIGISFTDKSETESCILHAKLHDKLKEDHFIESYTKGYTRFFFIPGSSDLCAENAQMQDDGKKWTPGRLFVAFKKVNKKKNVSRVLVSRFIGMISGTH